MGEVITFFGGDSQVGLTLLTASIAQGLKSRGRKSLVIFASSETDEGYFPAAREGNLGTLLRLSRILPDDVNACIETGPDFDYIKGPADILKKQFFTPEFLEEITTYVSKGYEYILLDAGHDVTLPLCAASISLADKRYYVLTGSDKCLTRFKAAKASVIDGLGIITSEDKLIVNKDYKRTSTYSPQEISELFGKEAYGIPRYDYPERCESDKATAFSRDSAYQKAVLLVVDDIIGVARKKK